ncbi:MAG: hypothetical protein LBO79_10470 [Zoogloeaceae bacterium]|jgi:hypothetical protein|nr:hypothetical protein [Zoogloeaceae bacterium]
MLRGPEETCRSLSQTFATLPREAASAQTAWRQASRQAGADQDKLKAAMLAVAKEAAAAKAQTRQLLNIQNKLFLEEKNLHEQETLLARIKTGEMVTMEKRSIDQ